MNYEHLVSFVETIYDTRALNLAIEDPSEALNIFERTNARGQDLEVADLLKNYLFSKKVTGIEKDWKEITENADKTLLKLLKYYYVSVNGYITKPRLYDGLKALGKKDGAHVLTTKLCEFSKYYYVIRNGDNTEIQEYLNSVGCVEIAKHEGRYLEIQHAIEGLREIKATQFYPVVYSAINCFVRCGFGKEPKKSSHLVSLFERLEKYHFINNGICTHTGNEVEKHFADFAVKFSGSNDYLKTLEEFTNFLRKNLASQAEFLAKFADLKYDAEPISFLLYIFDRMSNHGINSWSWARIYNPDPKIFKKCHNVEHFYANKPEDTDYVEDTFLVRNNIGNLLGISYKANSSLGNLNPIKKIEKLKGPLAKEIGNNWAVQEFIGKYGSKAATWGVKDIEARGVELASHAYEKVWKL